MYYIVCVELGQISKYELVKEADAIGLSEKDTMKYFAGNGETIDRNTYFKYKKRIQARKRDMLFTIAKHLPEVHVTQITAIHVIKKKVFTMLLASGDPFEVVALAKTLLDIERVISEYNGWTQKLTEATLKEYGKPKTEEPIIPIAF